MRPKAAHASLRFIPLYALAVGVEVARTEVTLVVQASPIFTAADPDIEDTLEELQLHLGPDVQESGGPSLHALNTRLSQTEGCPR